MVERVLRAVECVPPGRVASYGLIGALVGAGPRQVGAVLSRYGDGVPWWRIVNASGELPAPLLARALPRWRREGIEPAPHGRGCRYGRFAADAERLRSAVEARLAELE